MRQMATITQATLEKGSSLCKCRAHLHFDDVHLLSILFSYFLFFLPSPSIQVLYKIVWQHRTHIYVPIPENFRTSACSKAQGREILL